MIKSLNLILCGGNFDIVKGTDFSVDSDFLPHLVYEKNGVWNVISDPCRGRTAKTVITIPAEYTFAQISVSLSDGALEMCPIRSREFYCGFENASAQIDGAVSESLRVSSVRSSVFVNADSECCEIDCGFGNVDIRMRSAEYGYTVRTKCGMGSVTLNSVQLAKHGVYGRGARHINVICGMGNVNIGI